MTMQIVSRTSQPINARPMDARMQAFAGVQQAVKNLMNDLAESTDLREVETIHAWAKSNWDQLTMLVDAAGQRLHDLQGGQ